MLSKSSLTSSFSFTFQANNRGSLQILCEYYQLKCPSRGSTIKFHPLDHLHPLEYYRPDEALLHVAGSTIDLKSCRTSLELAEVHSLFFFFAIPGFIYSLLKSEVEGVG